MIGPPTSASPRPPVEVKTTSSDVSTPPVARDAAAVDGRPRADPIRLGNPSFPRPPRPPKTIIPVVSWTLLLPPPETIIDGMRTMTPEYPCAVGRASIRSVFERPLSPRALEIHDRAFTRHRDRFLERADFQVDVQRGDEVGRHSSPSRLTVLNPVSVKVTV